MSLLDEAEQIENDLEDFIDQLIDDHQISMDDIDYEDMLIIIKNQYPSLMDNQLFEPLFKIAFETVVSEYCYDSDQIGE